MPTQFITANNTSHSPLRNFGAPQPKYFNGLGGQLSDELKAKYRRDFEAYIKKREQLEKELEEETGLTPSRITEGETLQVKQRGEVDSTSTTGSKSVAAESINSDKSGKPDTRDAAANTGDFTTPNWEQ